MLPCLPEFGSFDLRTLSISESELKQLLPLIAPDAILDSAALQHRMLKGSFLGGVTFVKWIEGVCVVARILDFEMRVCTTSKEVCLSFVREMALINLVDQVRNALFFHFNWEESVCFQAAGLVHLLEIEIDVFADWPKSIALLHTVGRSRAKHFGVVRRYLSALFFSFIHLTNRLFWCVSDTFYDCAWQCFPVVLGAERLFGFRYNKVCKNCV